jgi:hypothetical protein
MTADPEIHTRYRPQLVAPTSGNAGDTALEDQSYEDYLRDKITALSSETFDLSNDLARVARFNCVRETSEEVNAYLVSLADRLYAHGNSPPRVLLEDALRDAWRAGRGYGRTEEPPFG